MLGSHVERCATFMVCCTHTGGCRQQEAACNSKANLVTIGRRGAGSARVQRVVATAVHCRHICPRIQESLRHEAVCKRSGQTEGGASTGGKQTKRGAHDAKSNGDGAPRAGYSTLPTLRPAMRAAASADQPLAASTHARALAPARKRSVTPCRSPRCAALNSSVNGVPG